MSKPKPVTKHPLYVIWNHIKQRCNNPNNRGWKNYGGRGITVCDQWMILENFVTDMGERPKGMTIERINNDLGYSPENCRWATPAEQSRNTRRNKLLTFDNKTLCFADWARELGIHKHSLRYRLRRYPIEVALSAPKKKGWPRLGDSRNGEGV